jgi:hypothetical protein
MISMAPPPIDFGISWIESNGLGEVSNGLVERALLLVGMGPPPICLGPLRFEPNGFREVSNCLVELALPIIKKGSTIEC